MLECCNEYSTTLKTFNKFINKQIYNKTKLMMPLQCTIHPPHWQSLCEKSPYSELFWSAFSRIRTEYGEIIRISLYSSRMRQNVDQNNSENGHFLRSVCNAFSFALHPFQYFLHNHPLNRSRKFQNVIRNILTYNKIIDTVSHHKNLKSPGTQLIETLFSSVQNSQNIIQM